MAYVTQTATALAPSDSELTAQLRLRVMRLARKLRQQNQEGDVTVSSLSALSSIERHGPLTLGELAAIEQVQPPTMTRIVSRLEEGGLVDRIPDPSDRRVQRVQVSGEGHRLLTRSRKRKDAYLARRIRQLDQADRDLLARALPILERLTGGDV